MVGNWKEPISPQTHAYDLKGSWQPIPHFCCKQSIPPIQVHDQNPWLEAERIQINHITTLANLANE